MTKYTGMVIGCGAIGVAWEGYAGRVRPRSHAGALARGARTTLVALVDADAKRLEAAGKLFPRAQLYPDAAVALESEKPDLVVIATPPRTHVPLIRLAAQAGAKMIICEKPLALSAREAASLRAVFARSKTVFVVNFQRRFWPHINQVRADIQAGKLGKITQVTCHYDNGLYNTGAHAVDTALYLLGDRAVKALAIPGNATTHPAHDPDVDGMLETRRGAHITLQGLDKKSYGLLEIRIFGSKGTVSVKDLGYTLEWCVPGRYRTMPTLVVQRTARKAESFVAGAHAETIACYEQKRKPISNLESSLPVLAALDALAKSAKTGRVERISVP